MVRQATFPTGCKSMASIIQIGSSWRATVRKKGHPQVSKTFQTKGKAQTWATRLEATIEDGSPKYNSDYTVGDLIEKYREFCEAKKPILHSSNRHYMLRHLDEGLGHIEATKLTVKHISDWVERRTIKQGAGPSTCYMELSTLKTVFKITKAHLDIELPDTISQAQVILTTQGMIDASSRNRDRRPTDEELKRLLEKLSPKVADIVRIASVLGLRRSEILGLKWTDLDESNKMIWVRNHKHPKPNKKNDDHIPLIEGSYEIITRQPKSSERIFSNITGETVSDAFLKCCRDLEIEDLHFHDLRHHAISCLFEAGLEIQEVALISGHKDWRHLRRYTNLKSISLHKRLEDLKKNNL